MAHTQKPDFIFRRNGRVHLNRRGASVQSTTRSRGVSISGSNAGGSVKSTGYPLHSPVSPSLPLPCVTVCHHISTGVYSAACCIVATGLMNGHCYRLVFTKKSQCSALLFARNCVVRGEPHRCHCLLLTLQTGYEYHINCSCILLHPVLHAFVSMYS